ncbi:MAG: YpsA SLOG family protein [Nitrospinales bacterium]
MIKKIISGGQTGADRAALDVVTKAKTNMPKCKKPRRDGL